MSKYEEEMERQYNPDPYWYDCLEDPDLGVSDDNWACGTLDVET